MSSSLNLPTPPAQQNQYLVFVFSRSMFIDSANMDVYKHRVNKIKLFSRYLYIFSRFIDMKT